MPVFLGKFAQALSVWMEIIGEQPFSYLATDFQRKGGAFTGPFRILVLNYSVPLRKALYINQAFLAIITDLYVLLKCLK